MNEVASALAFTDAALAIVPSGSGNGLARELKIPFDPAAAFDVALPGSRAASSMPASIDGRLFFNIAGIGLDARVAHRFAVDGLVRRGFLRYLELTIGELRGYVPDQLTVTTPSSSITSAGRSSSPLPTAGSTATARSSRPMHGSTTAGSTS